MKLQDAIQLGFQKYKCPLCPKIMSKAANIKQHTVTHTGAKNFDCKMENCNAKYSQNSALLRHVRQKHEISWWKFYSLKLKK